MIDKTIEDILAEYGWTLSRLAKEIGCCVAQVSKIKNGVIPITDEFQELFQARFPDYKLIGGEIRWKERYLELEERFRILAAKYMCQNDYIVQLNKTLANLKEIETDLPHFEQMFNIKGRKHFKR